MDTRARGGGSLSHINYTRWLLPSSRTTLPHVPPLAACHLERASPPTTFFPLFYPSRRTRSFRVFLLFLSFPSFRSPTNSGSSPLCLLSPPFSDFTGSPFLPLFFVRLVSAASSSFLCSTSRIFSTRVAFFPTLSSWLATKDLLRLFGSFGRLLFFFHFCSLHLTASPTTVLRFFATIARLSNVRGYRVRSRRLAFHFRLLLRARRRASAPHLLTVVLRDFRTPDRTSTLFHRRAFPTDFSRSLDRSVDTSPCR